MDGANGSGPAAVAPPNRRTTPSRSGDAAIATDGSTGLPSTVGTPPTGRTCLIRSSAVPAWSVASHSTTTSDRTPVAASDTVNRQRTRPPDRPAITLADVVQEIPALPGLTDLSPLGRGGFADVYLARQAHLDRFVAAKVFRVTLADRGAGDQFRAECQAVGRLDRHPNVITVHDANVLPDGRPYIVTEQCDGSLHGLVDSQGPLPAPRVVALGLAMARALLFAHSAKVLHGDVTPQNILLRATGAPVLADFGLAVLRDYQGNVASGFTLSHAAPETVRYDGAIDERTDVYGLGSTLYTALTGRPPIPARPGEEDAARAARVLGEQPLRPEGPEQLVDLLLAMLAKDPSDRPAMTVVADTLAGAAGPTPAAPPVPPSPGGISGGSPFAPVPPPPARVPVFAPPPDLRPAFPTAAEPVHDDTRRRAAAGAGWPSTAPRPCRRRVDPVAGRDTGARPLPGRSGRRTAPGAARNRRGGRRRRLRARRLVPAPGCGT